MHHHPLTPSPFAGSWSALADRLDRTGTLASWACAEPVLSGLVADDLLKLTARGSDLDVADDVLGALVRLAAGDAHSGGGTREDTAADAVLVLLHLLEPGIRSHADRLADLDPAADMAVVFAGELALQVRAFPWRRRTRAYAANLLLDTRRAVLAEYGIRRHVRPRETPVDPQQLWLDLLRREAQTVPAGAGDDDPRAELVEVLSWAVEQEVATVEDVEVLWRVHRLAGYGEAASDRVAADLGVSSRTVRRRQARTLAALRAVVSSKGAGVRIAA